MFLNCVLIKNKLNITFFGQLKMLQEYYSLEHFSKTFQTLYII